MINEEAEAKEQILLGFTLLKEAVFDKPTFQSLLEEDWGIRIQKDTGTRDDILLFEEEGMNVTVSLMPTKIPHEEAEQNARNNYMWKEAEEVTKQHTANLIVAVVGGTPLARGKLFVKISASTCALPHVLGFYGSGVVFEPKFYRDFAFLMKDDIYPVNNLIWFGLYPCEEGFSCYTYGLRAFGKEEMEVLNSSMSPEALREFLVSITTYILGDDVELKDGETIEVEEGKICTITLGDGVSLPGKTLQINTK